MKRIIALVICLSMLIFIPQTFSHAVYKFADVNGDGSINVKDVLALRKMIAGLPAKIIEATSDLNADGYINMKDVIVLRQHMANILVIDDRPIYDDYRISETYISGVSVREYSIIIPTEADLYTTYAAELLQDFFNDKMGFELPIYTDEHEADDYEFLIGATNREESAGAAVTLAEDEYLLKRDGTKIVLLGDAYMIGGGVGKLTYDYMTYNDDDFCQVCSIDNLPTSNTPMQYEAKTAKSAILMIGDGMGPDHPSLTLLFNKRNRYVEPDYTEFYAERLPSFALCTTSSLTTYESNGETPTDSAAAGTALACGYKTYNGLLGLDSNQRTLQNIRELAASLGKKSGVITTEPKEGATPAAFTVHVNNRKMTDVIATIQNSLQDCNYLKGDIGDNLLAETKHTLDVLSTNNSKGFFAMIEEAHIDKAGHGITEDGLNNKQDRIKLLHYMARFNNAIRYAMVFSVAHPDTLLIITADHETGGLTRGCQFTTTKHTGVDVNVYSIGGGSELLTDHVDNTDIPKVIAAQWGVNDFGDQTLGQ